MLIKNNNKASLSTFSYCSSAVAFEAEVNAFLFFLMFAYHFSDR